MAPKAKADAEKKRNVINVRFDDALHSQIREAAEISGRSLSGEVQHRLEDYERLHRAHEVITQSAELQRYLREIARLHDIASDIAGFSDLDEKMTQALFLKGASFNFDVHLALLLDGETLDPKIEEDAQFMQSRFAAAEAIPKAFVEYWQKKVDDAQDHVQKYAAQQNLDRWKSKADEIAEPPSQRAKKSPNTKGKK